MADAMGELPRYKCHKKVWALKIAKIDTHQGSALLHFHEQRFTPVQVSSEWIEKHSPQVDGYWVRYEDGYESFSPAGPFEAGYTKI